MENWNKVNNELSEAVLASDRLEELLGELGCDVRGHPGDYRLRGPCPVHQGADTNFGVGTHGHTLPIFWACFSHGCHKAGVLKHNLLGLVRGALTNDPHRPATMTEAKTFIEEFLAREGDRPVVRTTRMKPPGKDSRSWSREQVRQQLVVPSPYFVSRGFSRAVLDRFDIGDSPRLNRAVAPIYDDRGLCVGVISRSTKPTCDFCSKCHARTDDCGRGEVRWKFETGFPKAEHLYNYAAALQTNATFVLLVEGVPDVLRAAEAGVIAVAGFGTDLSVTQVVKLSALNKPVLVAFNNDPAGTAGAVSMTTLLRREGVRAVVKHPPEMYKDVAEMPAATVPGWLAA